MILVQKQVKGGTAPVFVFKFEDASDKNYWFDKWRECIAAADGARGASAFECAIDKLESRITDEYATYEYGLSGVLFSSEIPSFAFGAMMLMCNYKGTYDACATTLNRITKGCLELLESNADDDAEQIS